MDRGVRKPQPSRLPLAALGEGPQYRWGSELREAPVSRSGALRWILVGFLLTIMATAASTFGVSLYVVITDAEARVPVLTALLSAVTTLLSGCLLQLWRHREKSHGRTLPGSRRTRRKK